MTIATTISTEEAVRRTLALINSDIVPELAAEGSPGAHLEQLSHLRSLSSGEKVLVALASSLWFGPTPSQGPVGSLGSLDRPTAAAFIAILQERYVGAPA